LVEVALHLRRGGVALGGVAGRIYGGVYFMMRSKMNGKTVLVAKSGGVAVGV
jgi:hypothetical protein